MIISFIFGVMCGSLMVMGFASYQLAQLQKNKGNLMKKLKDKLNEGKIANLKDTEKGASITQRLIQAARLADAQMELRAQAEMPSKNALHSQYKNGLVRQIQDLELEKISVLKTVLGDGFDPIITVIRDGGIKEEIALSSYVAQSEQNLNLPSQPTAPAPTEPSALGGPRKAGKFVIYTGGKDDGGTTH